MERLLRRLRDRPVLILGGGITGTSVAKLFSAAGIHSVVVDEKKISLPSSLKNISIVENFSGASTRDFRECAFAISSPGIDPRGVFFQNILALELPIVSEIEFALHFLGRPLVAVTGTNGKTTTASLVHAMLNASGRPVQLVGNIGTPVVELVQPEQLKNAITTERPHNAADTVFDAVVELSSYQLESVSQLKAKTALWLNLDENHLERHGTMGDYLKAKARVFSGQEAPNDSSVLYAESPYTEQMIPFASGRVFFFGEHSKNAPGAFYDHSSQEVTLRYDGTTELYSLKNTHLLGLHNRLNLAAAIVTSRLSGASPEGIRKTITSFHPLEHRLETVRELDGVTYINDTKATTVAAAVAAVDAIIDQFPARPQILLLGGKAKYGSWTPLTSRIEKNCRHVICFGGDGKAIYKTLTATINREKFSEVPSLDEAVQSARRIAQKNDIVLFSPGCTSFDAFNNFEERGRHFKRLVKELT